jgi:outer membrane protein insertion porin family
VSARSAVRAIAASLALATLNSACGAAPTHAAGTDVAGHANAAPAPAPCSSAASSAPDTVLRVEVRGNARIPTATICAYLHTRAGGVFAEAEVRRDTRELFESGIFDDVQVTSEALPGGRALVFVVRERPRVRRLALSGVAPADVDRIHGLLGRDGDLFDGETLRTQIAEVRADYVERGHRSVEIAWKATPAEENQVDLAISVVEGPKALIRSVQLRGVATKAREVELLALMETGLGKFNVPGAIYREDAFELGRLRMNAWYYDHGMIDTNVSTEELTLSADRASLAIVVDVAEGPVYRIGELRCTGDLAGLAAGEATCRELLGVRTGDVFDRSAMVRGMERIRVQQAAKGRGTQIEPQTELDPTKKTVKLTVTIGR